MVLSEIKKFEIIVKHNDGLSIRKISSEMKIDKKTVNRWILRYKNQGNLNRKIGSGQFRHFNQ